MTPTVIFRTAVPGLRSVLHRLALAALVLLVAACATRTAAPVEERRPPPPRVPAPGPPQPEPRPLAPGSATEADIRSLNFAVKRGDTLHAIALDHGLDYRGLAAWNNLDNPNLIRVGQVLRVRPPGET